MCFQSRLASQMEDSLDDVSMAVLFAVAEVLAAVLPEIRIECSAQTRWVPSAAPNMAL